MPKVLNILIGIPGSGKSYYAIQFLDNTIYLNADTMREVIAGDVNDQTKNGIVFAVLRNMAEYFCKLERGITIDNCNQMVSRRKEWIAFGKKYGYKIRAICMKTPYEECLKRNVQRARVVPEFVLQKMYNEFQAPTPEEGFDEIIYV